LYFGKSETRQDFKIAREANLCLTGGKVILKEGENEEIRPQKHWTAIKAAHGKIGVFIKSCILVSLYNAARTYFEQNPDHD